MQRLRTSNRSPGLAGEDDINFIIRLGRVINWGDHSLVERRIRHHPIRETFGKWKVPHCIGCRRRAIPSIDILRNDSSTPTKWQDTDQPSPTCA